jgi:predicted  nucleic acid-binding Zn-ribbon protein
VFQDTLTELMSDTSPLLKVDPKYRELKANYESWKTVLTGCMDDLRDYERMNQEMSEVDNQNHRLRDDVAHYQTKLRDQKKDTTDLQVADEELRELLDVTKRWSEDAGRISEKRAKIVQEQEVLTASNADFGRDVTTVELELNRMNEEKDELANKISALNREMSGLNNRAAGFAAQAANMDRLARGKEETFAAERKNHERMAELSELLKDLIQEEKVLQDQIAPLNKKISAKKTEQERTRALGEEGEERLSKEVSAFDADVKVLRNLNKEVRDFEESSAAEDLESISSKVQAVLDQIEKKQQDAKDLEPRLEETKNAVNDQERHKKQLIQNIEIVEAGELIVELNRDIEKLERKRKEIEGLDTVNEEHEAAIKGEKELQEKKYRTEGRFSEVVEQIRSTKVSFHLA